MKEFKKNVLNMIELFIVCLGILQIEYMFIIDIYIQSLDLYMEAESIFNIVNSTTWILYLYIIFWNMENTLLFKMFVLGSPMYCYYLIKLMSIQFDFGIVLGLIALLGILIFMIIYLKINWRSFKWKKMIQKILLITNCFTLLSIPSIFLTKKILYYDGNSTYTNKENDDTDSQLEQLVLFEKENWKYSDLNQRIEALRTVIDIECDYFGIDKIPGLEVKYMEGIKTGQYNYESNIISVNRQFLEDSKDSYDVLSSILHECNHVYQLNVINSFNYEEISNSNLRIFIYPKKLIESFENYPAESDKEGYSKAFIEIDSYIYASERIKQYQEQVLKLNQKKRVNLHD